MEPKLSKRFQSTVERRLKNRKPKLIDKIELQEFSLGSCPPTLGDQGMRWITSGDQVSHIYSEPQVHLKVSLVHIISLLGSL